MSEPSMKLTGPQRTLLQDLAEFGSQPIAANYRPAIRLKELGLAVETPDNVRIYTPNLQITDAGRAALSAPSPHD